MSRGVIETLQDELKDLSKRLARAEDDVERFKKRVRDLESPSEKEDGEVRKFHRPQRRGVFVSGIRPADFATEDELASVFEALDFGHVSRCKIFARTGSTEKTLAKVEFEDEDVVDRVLRVVTRDKLKSKYGFDCKEFNNRG